MYVCFTSTSPDLWDVDGDPPHHVLSFWNVRTVNDEDGGFTDTGQVAVSAAQTASLNVHRSKAKRAAAAYLTENEFVPFRIVVTT